MGVVSAEAFPPSVERAVRPRSPGLRTFLALGLLAITGCLAPEGPPSSPAPVTPASPPPAAVAASPAARVFKLARVPFKTARSLYEGHEKFLNTLADALEDYDRVELVAGKDYADVMQRIIRGEAHAGWVGTVAYVEALEAYRSRGEEPALLPVLCPIRDGRTYYRGVIFAHREWQFAGLEALAGKRIAFVDPQSASGYFFPSRMLQSHGVEVPGGLETREKGVADFLGKHDAVVTSVYMKSFHAGAVFEDAIEEAFSGPEESKRNDLVILDRTEKIPNEPILVPRSLSEKSREAVVRAFLTVSIPPEIEKDLSGVSGFARVKEDQYLELLESRRSEEGSR